jgi:7-cyano-7-deazaguanine synthase
MAIRPLASTMTGSRALVLLSGGIDSGVALHWALREGHEVLPLTFDYHLRPQRELQAVGALLARARSKGRVAPLQRIEVPFLREVEDLPAAPAHLAGAPEGYIPARNLVFYSIAASLAEVAGARFIVGGHNGTDPELFPDSSPTFFATLNGLLRKAVWSHARAPVEVVVPIAGKSKADVLRLGVGLGVPFELTWSCYHDGKEHCGACGSCTERREAFAEAGMRDPTSYAKPERSAAV